MSLSLKSITKDLAVLYCIVFTGFIIVCIWYTTGSKCGRRVGPSTRLFSVTTEVFEIWGFHSGTAGGSGLPRCYVMGSGK
jgi:hypothetical protein